MLSIDDIRIANLETLIARFGTQRALADAAGIKNPAQISQWLNRSIDHKTGKPRVMKSSTARALERALRLQENWMDTDHHAREENATAVRETRPPYSADTTARSIAIQRVGAFVANAGSDDPRGHLSVAKPAYWFRERGATPSNVIAVLAPDDGMAAFIVAGDIVIFDTTKTDLRSGAIVLIEHPDGLQIRRLRRRLDGTWTLESDNPDKLRYPDEPIACSQLDLLKIRGTFVYREGG